MADAPEGAPLASSTRYSIALAGERARRTAGVHFEVVHRPLAVAGLWGVDRNAPTLDAALPLSFNRPVRPADAAAHCRLVSPPVTSRSSPTSPRRRARSRWSPPRRSRPASTTP